MKFKFTLLKSSTAIIPAVILLGMAGCAPAPHYTFEVPPVVVSQPVVEEPKPTLLDSLIVPAGVDTFVALSATIAARQVLVGAKEESLATAYYQQGLAQTKEGKPLWELFKKSQSPQEEVAPEDTLENYKYYEQAYDQMEKGDRILKGKRPGYDLFVEDLINHPEELRRRAARCYELARDLYEKAWTYNPWDEYTKYALIEAYSTLIEIHRSLGDIDDAIQAIENYLLWYPSQYYFQGLLGRCYAEKGDTLGALLAYRKAEDLLLFWAPIPMDEFDTTITDLDNYEYRSWSYYVTEQISFELSLKMEECALADLYRLKRICSTDHPADSAYFAQRKENCQYQIDWLVWDGGDLAATQLWDQVKIAANLDQWGEARRMIDDLLPMLDVPDAIFEVEQYAARIDYVKLRQYESALERMRRLINQHGFKEVDSNLDTLLMKMGKDQFAEMMAEFHQNADEKVIALLDDYGDWCDNYAYGIETVQGRKETAYIYYYQSAIIPWSGQAHALFNLAYISKNQPEKVILYGETAMTPQLNKGLRKGDREILYTYLLNAYRRLNDRPRAEYYHQELMALRNSSTSNVEQ